LQSLEWTTLAKPEICPKGRDDHASCQSSDKSLLYVFGGYVAGSKANDLWAYNIESNSWTELDSGDY